MSRSLATGKLQATLKLIVYVFLNRFFSNFKNLSRSRATGNLQATLHGFFLGNPYFEQESRHRQITGNPETDLLFCLSRFFFESSNLFLGRPVVGI